MPATGTHHIQIADSDGAHGFITKQYSARQKPDTLFGSRFSTGDISYSTMNRWQRFAQSTWIGGAFQKYLESISKFFRSINIDVLTNGEFKLAKALSSSPKYNGSSAIRRGVVFNGATYFASGQYVYYTTDNYFYVQVSKAFGDGITVYDLEIYDGKLYAATGANGLWEHDTSDHTTWTEKEDSAATVPCFYLMPWGDNLHLTYNNIIRYMNNAGAFTTVKDFGDTQYYLGKPKPYGGRIYYPINVGASDGRGEVWYYNGTTLDIVFSSNDSVGNRMEVYDSLLIFVVYGLTKVSIKQHNGTTTVTLKSFDIQAGTTLYGMGLAYGTGALYGAGSDKYLDPVDFAVWDNNLVIAMQRTATQNTLLLYDTFGWTEYLTLPTGGNYYASLWLEARNLFIGGSDGDIYQVESTFNSVGYLQGSLWDADLQDINKLFAEIVLKHEPIAAGDSIEVWYRQDSSQNFVYLDTADTTGATQSNFTFPSGANSVISTAFEYKLILHSANGSTSPVVKDVVIRYILAPENSKRVFEYTIECTKKMKLLDGSFETRTPAEIVEDLWALKVNGELLTLTDENAETHTVVFSDTTPEVVTPFAGDVTMEKYVYIRLFEL